MFSPAALYGLAEAVRAAFGEAGARAWLEALREGADDDPRHHAAVYLYGLAAHETWVGAGGSPDALYGDSLGVYAAIAASGALGAADGVRLVLAAGEAIRAAQAELDLRLLSITGLVREDVAEIVSGRPGSRITHHNSSMQFLVSGPPAELREIEEEAGRRGAFRAKLLGLPGVVHRPEVGAFTGGFRETLREVEVADPVRPLYSCVTARRVADAAEVRRFVEDQLSRPVLFMETVDAIAAAGARAHVVLGSCPDLAKLLAWSRPEDRVAVFPFTDGGGEG